MTPSRTFGHARGEIALDRCLVMGIVNRTPDSFYDGGRMGLDESVKFALRLAEEGADILDLGAVKAGPGEPVSVEEEEARLLPLVEQLAAVTEVPVSVETMHAAVARSAVEAGAAMVNDVSGLADPALAPECARSGAGLLLMHHGGQIRARPRHPRYRDVVAEVKGWLESAARRAEDAGVERDSLVLDPGLDFGKTVFHSLELMRCLEEVAMLPWPLLVAPSRKDIVGESLDLPADERLEGTLAVVCLSVLKGAAIVRVHDVRAAVRVVRMTETVMGRRAPDAPVRGLWD